jgi:hypothetical protein
MNTTTTGTLKAPLRKRFTRAEWVGIMRRIHSLTDRAAGLSLLVSEERETMECSLGASRRSPWQ